MIEKNEFLSVISITKDSIKEEIEYSEIFDSILFVPLETNEQCLINKIDRIEVTSDRIYILDSFMGKSIFVFNIEGKFIFKINNVGRGPGEFIRPVDFYVDSNKKQILVYTSHPRRVLKYDYFGRFIDETKMDISCLSFTVVNDEFYIYTCGQESVYISRKDTRFNLIRADKNGNITGYYLPFDKSNKGYPNCSFVSPGGITNFFANQSNTIFSMMHNDIIYSIDSSGVKPEFEINFNSLTLPESLIRKNSKSPDLNEIIAESGYAYNLKHVLADSLICYFEYSVKSQRYKVFYDRKTEELTIAKKFTDNMSYIYPEIISMHEDFLVGIKQPFDLIDEINYQISKNDSCDVEELLQDDGFINSHTMATEISVNDNPVIAFLKLKDR